MRIAGTDMQWREEIWKANWSGKAFQEAHGVMELSEMSGIAARELHCRALTSKEGREGEEKTKL